MTILLTDATDSEHKEMNNKMVVYPRSEFLESLYRHRVVCILVKERLRRHALQTKETDKKGNIRASFWHENVTSSFSCSAVS